MAHIDSIGAGMYSDLSVSVETLPSALTETNLKGLFATEIANGSAPTASAGEFVRIKNVREFPAMGTPPNIVNVPTYGQATTQQIQGQSDAPTMEIQLNYVGKEWQETANFLGKMVGDGKQYVFRFALLNAQPTAASNAYASTEAGLGTVQNSQYFWVGKMEALLVTPQLTDANTATLTLTMQSEFYGAFTS